MNIHMSCKRALLTQTIGFKHAILQHKLYKEKLPVTDSIELNFNQILTSCQTHFKITKYNKYKAENNKLASRLSILNGKIPLQDFNMSLNTFKVKHKKSIMLT